MTLKAYLSGRINQASQNENRDFINLLARVSAARKELPPALIYGGEAHCIRDSWLENFKPTNKAYFATLSNG